MRTVPSQSDDWRSDLRPFPTQKLLTVAELCAVFGVSPAWVYKRTKKDAVDPLPVYRLSGGSVRFEPDKIASYLASRERHRTNATLDAFDGIARVNRKGKYTLTRKRFQAGSVRLRTDRGPAYWQGFYWDDIITEAGKKVRKRIVANLGSLKEVPNEKVARQKLAVILNPINDVKHKPKQMMTFSGFIAKYRTLKMANQKGTTVHGYETNIRAHYLPEFGDWALSDITDEDVQTFLNQKRLDGYAVQTLKNLKWGLSSIFESAIKYGYLKSNPACRADLPPEGVRERKELPSGDQLMDLICVLKEPINAMVYLVSVTSIRPEELAFKWLDLDAETRELWVVRAMNQGKFHTPKYHRSNRPIRLTEADVHYLLALKERAGARDEDWMFPNRIKKGKIRKPGPIWHEHLLARHIQPAAERLGLPHITWRLLRHWGTTMMTSAKMDLSAVQQRLGHSRPNILLEYYAHVLPPSADEAAGLVSGKLGYTIPAESVVNPVAV
jgi:integrase/predicted DNA-binding transcriptional regulator AlpA